MQRDGRKLGLYALVFFYFMQEKHLTMKRKIILLPPPQFFFGSSYFILQLGNGFHPLSPSCKQDPIGLIPSFFQVLITFTNYQILIYLELKFPDLPMLFFSHLHQNCTHRCIIYITKFSHNNNTIIRHSLPYLA